jgi:hypothetical protein
MAYIKGESLRQKLQREKQLPVEEAVRIMMRGAYGKPVAYLGFATGVLDIVGSYPDAIGPMLTLVCQVFFAAWFVAWFVAVGSKLYRLG